MPRRTVAPSRRDQVRRALFRAHRRHYLRGWELKPGRFWSRRGALFHRNRGAASQAFQRGQRAFLALPQARYRASRRPWFAPVLIRLAADLLVSERSHRQYKVRQSVRPSALMHAHPGARALWLRPARKPPFRWPRDRRHIPYRRAACCGESPPACAPPPSFEVSSM